MVNINNQAQKICPGTSNKTKAQTKCSQLLPATVNLTRHKDSVDRTGQGNIWFVGCSTTAWATWTPGESEPCDVKDAMKKTEQVYMVHDTIYIFAP